MSRRSARRDGKMPKRETSGKPCPRCSLRPGSSGISTDAPSVCLNGRGRAVVEEDRGPEGVDSDSIVIGQREYAVWPAEQHVHSVGHRTIGLTTFSDAPALHPALVSRVRELESDVRFAARFSRAGGGVKVYHLDRWESGEAD